MNKKEIEKLFERELGENPNIHIEMEVEPYSDLCMEPFRDDSYKDWVKDGSFDLKMLKIRVLNHSDMMAAIDLILFAEEDVEELGFDKTSMYLDFRSGSLSHITKLILDDNFQKECGSYSYEINHCMPFSGELRTLYIAKAYRKKRLGAFLLDNLNQLLEYEFRIHVCSLVVYLHPFLNDVFMGGYTEYANEADRIMLKAMEKFYHRCDFVKFTEEPELYIRKYALGNAH